jgi:hypothetical protein
LQIKTTFKSATRRVCKHTVKAFYLGQFLGECLIEAATIIFPEKVQKCENPSLNTNTVAECTNDAANELSDQ